MRGRLTLTLTIALLAALLVALNAASYVRVEPEPDLELTPDRSTDNAGATGTRALYDYLAESGRQVVRWRESPAALSRQSGAAHIGTFVVVGALRVKFKPEEASAVLQWVRNGGRLVLIDRRPDARLLPPGAGWRLVAEAENHPAPDVRADDDNAMTAGAGTIAPTQPTLLTGNVERIAPSRFAARLRVVPAGNRDKADGEDASSDEADGDEADGDELPPPPR